MTTKNAGSDAAKNGENLAVIQRGNSKNPTPKKPRGKPFARNDTRINRKGAPKRFAEIRELFKKAMGEIVPGQKRIGIEYIAHEWIASGDYYKQARAVEIAYGKVPDAEYQLDIYQFMLKNAKFFSDQHIDRLIAGDDIEVIFAEFLKECIDAKKFKERMDAKKLSEGA